MNVYRSRPLTYPWATFSYSSAIALSVGLERLSPLNFLTSHSTGMQLSGLAVALAGAVLMVWALLTLSRNQTAVTSMKFTTRLVTSGPFRLSRNPTYLGFTIFTLGLALALNNVWLLPFALIAASITHLYVVRREEEYLHARFGYEFERYCQRTRAWF